MSIHQKTAALAVGLLLSFHSYGQTQSDLSAITVYASRFGEKLTDSLPQTRIISSDEIQKSGASNISEALSKVAGLPTKINLDGSTNAVIDMRGFGDTADNNVVVLLDGIRLSENEQTSARTSMIPLEAIDHIEITRGGNSVLYGDGATSGTINIVTKKNTGNLTVATAGIASYSGYQSSLYHSRQLGNNDISVFARQYASDNYRQNSRGTEQSAGFNWINHLDGQTNLGARLLASQEKNKLPGPLPFSYLNSSPKNTEVPGYNYDANVNSTSLTLFANKKIDNVELSIDLNQRIRSNSDAYSYDARNVYSGYNNPGWNQSYSQSNKLTNNQSLNPRVKINDFLIAGNTLQLGYDWNQAHKSNDGFLTYGAGGGYPGGIAAVSNFLNYKTSSFYIRNNLTLNSTDQITWGYRYQKYNQSFTDIANASNWASNKFATANEMQYTKNIAHNLSTYVRIGQNFRIPNVDDNSQAYDQSGSLIPLTPQISHDIDIGLKYLSSSYSTDIIFFSSRIKNEIGFDPMQYANVNYDPTKREGVNLLQKIRISKNISTHLNIQYVNAQFIEGIYSGNHIPNVSNVTGNVGIDYQVSAKQQISIASRFANHRYMSGDFMNTQPKVAGYVVEDLSYFYREKSWSVTATISNITNKQYSDVGIYKPSYTPPYNLLVYPNPGRNFSLMGRYSF